MKFQLCICVILLGICVARQRNTKDNALDNRKYEVGFLLDNSVGLGHRNLEASKEMVEDILSRFSIAPSNTRVALTSSTSGSTPMHRFNDTINREHFLRVLQRLRLTKSATDAKKALYYMYKAFIGERRAGTGRYLFIFVDGGRHHLLRSIIGRILEADITTFVFALGRRIAVPGLKYVASTVKSGRWRSFEWRPDNYERMIRRIGQSKGSYTSCHGDGYVRDECDRLCKCVDGEKRDCYRVRKEFNEMSYDERVRYVNAFKTLANTPQYKPRYDALIKIHMTKFCSGIHNGNEFLPWHRWYIWSFENLLREIDCRITVPYWDWSYWSKHPWTTDHIWRETPDGLGGSGNANDSFCVKRGPFSGSQFKLPGYYVTESVVKEIRSCSEKRYGRLNTTEEKPACLRRSFHGKPPTADTVLRLLHLKGENYTGFVTRVADGFHNDIHNFVGGDMCTNYASLDPIFFMHHGFLDKIWFLWQSIRPEHLQISKQKNIKLRGGDYYSHQFYNPHNQAKDVKFTYSSFGQVDSLNTVLEDFYNGDKRELETSSKAKNETVPKIAGNCDAIEMASFGVRDRVRAFIKDKNFVYNPSLLSHLDEYNLEQEYNDDDDDDDGDNFR